MWAVLCWTDFLVCDQIQVLRLIFIPLVLDVFKFFFAICHVYLPPSMKKQQVPVAVNLKVTVAFAVPMPSFLVVLIRVTESWVGHCNGQ